MDIQTTGIFLRNWETEKKIVVNRGGTRSSKTYSICQVFALWLWTGFMGKEERPRGIATVVRKYSTTLDSTVLRDFEEILHDWNIYQFVRHDKIKKIFKFGKRLVEFVGADNQQKLRGGKRDYLYCNEANELHYNKEFFQLLIRTTRRVWLDFNPDDPDIWINTEIEMKRQDDVGDVEVIVSNYLDNPYLGAEQVKEIEYLKVTDEQFWKIYGLGEYGKISGLIYPNWTIARLPEGVGKRVAYGMDFGFSNDPTCLLDVWMYDGKLYVKELIYEKRLTNQDIITRLRELLVSPSSIIIADSAEPKSIETIHRSVFNIHGALKGPDSIEHGIDILKRYEIVVDPDSVNLLYEIKKYRWAEDKTGNQLRQPVKRWDHCMDALRYVALNELFNEYAGNYEII